MSVWEAGIKKDRLLPDGVVRLDRRGLDTLASRVANDTLVYPEHSAIENENPTLLNTS